ncbi:MAG: phosphomethylpyrimidine synthase ThiC [Desulfobulbaceae bacterium]|nr:phosphomethylpyrimidine synthase ThiC [Desulfobulbaceae bacterium]
MMCARASGPTRLAARIGDIAKYPERRQREKAVVLARRDTRWDDHFGLLMSPEEAARIRQSRTPGNQKTCTMCGDFCAMERDIALFKDDIRGDKVSEGLR